MIGKRGGMVDDGVIGIGVMDAKIESKVHHL